MVSTTDGVKNTNGIQKYVSKEYLRDLPGWKDAPVPICMGGDYRALSWCCKPGSTLTFGYKCLRDQKLKEIGVSPKRFIEIKEQFSKEHEWDSDYPCFGSFSYCCMRRGGCSHRDLGLKVRYPDKSFEEIFEEYVKQKKILAKLILKDAKNQDTVKVFLEFM